MNCTVLQRRLLSAEQPDQPPADLQGHLAQCPVCRAWQRRLVQIERQIPLLPVPPSTARDELLGRILGTRPPAPVRPAVPLSELAQGPKERGLRKLSVALALAASLLVFAIAWWSWPRDDVAAPGRQQRATRWDRDQQTLDERLGSALVAATPHEKLLRLADLADEVQGEATRMEDDADRLDQWARFYSRVVSEHLLEQARQLPPADRPAVLETIALRLQETDSNASKQATRLEATAPRSAALFAQIARTARQGGRNLRSLVNA